MNPNNLRELQQRYTTHLRAGNRSEETITHYEDSFRDLYRFLAAKQLPEELDSLTSETCEQYALWLRETPTKLWRGKTERSIFGVNGRLRDLKAFLGFLDKFDLLDRKIRVPSMKLPQQDYVVFSDDELRQIFASDQLTKDAEVAVRNRAIVAVLLDSGLRLGEITGLQLEDVEFDSYLLRVCGKGKRIRRVPFSPTSEEYLRDWLIVRGHDPGSLFELTYHGIRMVLRRVQLETGVHIHPHRFRHTAATKLARAGKSASVVQKFLGHTHIATAQIYVNLTGHDLREQHHTASPLESIGTVLPGKAQRKKRLTY